MKRILLSITACFLCGLLFAQQEIGVWESYDNKRHKPMSHVQIYQKDGKLYGKVVKSLDNTYTTCTKCSDADKNKPIVGLLIIRGLEKEGNKWEKDDGILDPMSGLLLDGELWMDGPDKLKIKGSYGFLNDTQTWRRIK